MAEMTRADVIERLRWIDREAHDEWVLVPAEREAALRHAIAALALHDEHERLTAAHATLLSREAKEGAITAAFNAGYCYCAKQGKSHQAEELEAKARRLLDLDPEP